MLTVDFLMSFMTFGQNLMDMELRSDLYITFIIEMFLMMNLSGWFYFVLFRIVYNIICLLCGRMLV